MKPAIILLTLLFGAGCAVGGFAWGFRMGYQGQVLSEMVTDARINAALLQHLEAGNTEQVKGMLAGDPAQEEWLVRASEELERRVYRFGEAVGDVDLLR